MDYKECIQLIREADVTPSQAIPVVKDKWLTPEQIQKAVELKLLDPIAIKNMSSDQINTAIASGRLKELAPNKESDGIFTPSRLIKGAVAGSTIMGTGQAINTYNQTNKVVNINRNAVKEAIPKLIELKNNRNLYYKALEQVKSPYQIHIIQTHIDNINSTIKAMTDQVITAKKYNETIQNKGIINKSINTYKAAKPIATSWYSDILKKFRSSGPKGRSLVRI